MPIDRLTIERMAELAGLQVYSETLDDLSGEITAILEFVSQIGCAEQGGGLVARQDLTGEAGVRLREDEPTCVDSIPDPGTFAPEFEGGFFVVPRPDSVS